MKKILFIITCLAFMAGSAAWGNSELNQLHMNWSNNEVVLKADLSSAFQFKHEIAEAKDGKPFRVVIDMFPAVHNLSQNDFANLPPSIVKSIRTSQYSTDPDQIARIVLDLDKSAVYRIEKKANSVYIYIPDNNSKGFASWSSTVVDKTKTETKAVKPAVAKTKAEEKPFAAAAPAKVKKSDHKAAKKVASKKTTAKKVVKQPEPTKYSYLKPSNSNDFDRQFAFEQNQWTAADVQQDKKLALNAEPKSAKTEAKKAVAQPAKSANKKVAVKAEPKKSQDKKAVAKKETKAAVEQPALAVNVPAKEQKPQMVKPKYSYNKPESSSVLDKDRIVDNSESKALAVKDSPAKKDKATSKPSSKEFKKVKKSELADSGSKADKMTDGKAKSAKGKDGKPTSRFRRKPAFPTKLKGTIVAEFPTRMVIKYKPSSFRDPFATLINEEGNNSDSPITKRIPDVETSRLVGVLESSDGTNSALLEDMDGIGYILNSGDKVKKGYVSKIYANKALFQLFEYGWSRTVALRLNNGE